MWLNIYCGHPTGETPNDDVMIWRYIKDEIIKIDGIEIDVVPNMLETNCLHFTRADQFLDEWEGTPSTNDLPMYDLLNECRKRNAINCWNWKVSIHREQKKLKKAQYIVNTHLSF